MHQCKSFAVSLLCAILAGCSDTTVAPAVQTTSKPSTSTAVEKIVSLSPAATDLLLAMNGGGGLVGVSSFDSDARVAGLPRVGDYENVDWERIAALAPKHMIVQMAAERVPKGFRERAQKLGIELHVIQIDRLTDSVAQAFDIGKAVGQLESGAKLRLSLINQMLRVTERTDGLPRVKTLIALSEDGLAVAGTGTYLDDALIAAGGVNALGDDRAGYLKIDRELLLTLAPDAIIQLAPSSTAAERATSEQNWKSMPSLPAVRDGRVLVIDEPWALQPGSHVGDLAECIANFLHPKS